MLVSLLPTYPEWKRSLHSWMTVHSAGAPAARRHLGPLRPERFLICLVAELVFCSFVNLYVICHQERYRAQDFSSNGHTADIGAVRDSAATSYPHLFRLSPYQASIMALLSANLPAQ